jgi:2-iminobutanoate/2-iminopropanoate deaminase
MTAKTQTAEIGSTLFTPLNRLKKSPRNARTTPHPKADIEALAASIAAKGLLQNLVVEPEREEDGKVTGYYLVTIGEGRRLAYSEAVITEGGRMVWLAGQTATLDDNGKSLASDFDGQVRQPFKNLDRTLQKAGGKLGDLVQMTVFITDVRYGDRLTQIRREVFGDNFPGSALITITALAVPDAKIEIQGYAVIGGR